MGRLFRYSINLILVLLLWQNALSQNSADRQAYFFYPKSYKTLHYAAVAGLSITKLPIALVDDEVNTSPMLKMDFRIGVSKRVDLNLQFYSNYLANLGSVGFQWMLLDSKLAMAIGENTSVWFGHLDLEAIQLKSMGVVVAPTLSIGYDANYFTLTAILEIQSSYMNTLSNDILLGEFYLPFSAYNFKFIIEQPLWNEHWVTLEIKLNYAKFYYQSWLTYSNIDEFFFYPEFSFGFIL